MIVKMSKRATPEEIAAVEDKLHDWGYKTGKMVGEEITLIGVYGNIFSWLAVYSLVWLVKWIIEGFRANKRTDI